MEQKQLLLRTRYERGGRVIVTPTKAFARAIGLGVGDVVTFVNVNNRSDRASWFAYKGEDKKYAGTAFKVGADSKGNLFFCRAKTLQKILQPFRDEEYYYSLFAIKMTNFVRDDEPVWIAEPVLTSIKPMPSRACKKTARNS